MQRGKQILSRLIIPGFLALFSLSRCEMSLSSSKSEGDTVYLKDQPLGTLTHTAPPSSSSAGHFALEGTARNPCFNYVVIQVRLQANPQKQYYYFIQGNPGAGYAWEQEVYLRYGPGAYTLTFWYVNMIQVDLQGEGAVLQIGGRYFPDRDVFTVSNTQSGANAEDWQLLPSGDVQMTPEIRNLSYTICAGAATLQDKIKKINQWIVINLQYDEESLVAGRRKKQDARFVYRNRLGVCEGYANLTAALLRSAGIPTRYVRSDAMNHAWLQVRIGGSWEMVDATWNDPLGLPPLTDTNWEDYVPWTEKYLFLTGNTGFQGDHHGGEWLDSRGALENQGAEPASYAIMLERTIHDF